MADDRPWHLLGATEISDQLQSGAVTPTQLAEYFLRRAERDTLGAYVRVTPDTAMRQAAALERVPPARRGRLWGLPHADKDLLLRRGTPTLFGSAAAVALWNDERNPLMGADNDPLVDVVDRLGLVSLGKTNTPEFGMTGFTESAVAAPARHPEAVEFGAGGSSGGAAVAVASGLLPAAIGSDGGGSVRIPAATVGLVGLKPTLGAVATDALNPGTTGVVTGPLARTAADVALFFAALSGTDTATLSRAALDWDLGSLKIGVATDSPWQPTYPVEISTNSLVALDVGRRVLEGICGRVSSVSLADDDYGRVFLTAWRRAAAGIPAFFDRTLLEPLTAWLIGAGQDLTREQRRRNDEELAAFRRRMSHRLEPFDIVATPALGLDPQPVGSYSADPATNFGQQVRYSPFTSFVNVLGWPAITVPVCRVTVGARSLPASVQLVARPGQEALLLRLATDLERAVGAGVSP